MRVFFVRSSVAGHVGAAAGASGRRRRYPRTFQRLRQLRSTDELDDVTLLAAHLTRHDVTSGRGRVDRDDARQSMRYKERIVLRSGGC